jgi:hypothetical protein
VTRRIVRKPPPAKETGLVCHGVPPSVSVRLWSPGWVCRRDRRDLQSMGQDFPAQNAAIFARPAGKRTDGRSYRGGYVAAFLAAALSA